MSRAEAAPQTWNVVTTARAMAQKTLSRAETRAPTPTKEMRELTPAVNARCSAASTDRVGAIVAHQIASIGYHITFDLICPHGPDERDSSEPPIAPQIAPL